MAADDTASAKPETRRPLSPHLQIYAWSWTMAMSVAHRATGLALYGGTLLLAAWLVAAASGKGGFDAAQWLAASWFGLLVLLGYTYALFHHMIGGLRHFVWDAGLGYSARQRLNLARVTPFAAGALTLLAWIAGHAAR